VDWSLLKCARKGHVTYAPDEPALRDRLHVATPAGEAWRCLRCGTYVHGEPHGRGPADHAPLVMRGRELRDELRQRGDSRPELRVVAPVLPSRSHYIASDIDRELGEARTRLDQALAWAAEHGFEATGRVGDMTPLVAIEDELRSAPVDEVIISTHVAARSHWLESGLVERAREELDIPVTHVVVDLANQQVQIATGEQQAAS
jgi:hypothetical protein